MKARPSTTGRASSEHDARIDAVLRSFAHAEPAPGLESRVAARLAAAHPKPSLYLGFTRSSGLSILRRLGGGAFTLAACAGIVVATIHHSERALPPQAIRQGSTNGSYAAGVLHVPTRAMPKRATIDPDAPRTAPRDRARVSRNQAHRATGAAVPRSPYPPGQPPGPDSNSQP